MPQTNGIQMGAFTTLFNHEQELLGVENVKWGRPVKVRLMFTYIGIAFGLRIVTKLMGFSLSPIGALLVYFIVPGLAIFAQYKRLKFLQQRTIAQASTGKMQQALMPSETHSLQASFAGLVGSVRYFGLRLLEMLLPHTAIRPRYLYAEGPLLFTTDGEVYCGFVRDATLDNQPGPTKDAEYRKFLGLYRERARHGGGYEQIKVYKPQYDTSSWKAQTLELVQPPPASLRAARRDPASGWKRLIEAEAKMLIKQDFRPRRILHLQLLGRRENRATGGFFASVKRFISSMNYTMGVYDELPGREEVAKWLTLSQPVQAQFRAVRARAMTTSDLYDSIIHEVWRGFPSDSRPTRPKNTPLTSTDFRRFLAGPVRVKGKGEENVFDIRLYGDVRMYAAHVLLTLPTNVWIGAGNEFLYVPETAETTASGHQVTVDITVTSEYFDKVEGNKLMKNRLLRIKNNISHYREFRTVPPEAWYHDEAVGLAIQPEIAAGRDALMRSAFVLTIEGPSVAVVREKISELRRLYAEMEIEVEHPGDLQPRLAASIMPGSRILVPEYRQWVNAGLVCGSGLTSTVKLGSKGGGNFWGIITRGGDGPVMLDPREARRVNRPGGIALGGDQGGGKSQTGKSLCVGSGKKNVPSIILDFKAQETNRMQILPDLDVDIWNLTGDVPGQLDPYVNFPTDAARPAFEAFSTLLGHSGGRALDMSLRTTLREACLEADQLTSNRSMNRVLEILKRTPDLRDLVSHFEAMQDYDLSKLFFAQDGLEPVKTVPQTMAIQVKGLGLPEEKVKPEDYTDVHWLSIAAINGIGYKIQSLAYHAEIPDLMVFFDENHVLEKTSIGNVLLEGTSRFSRFLGVVPVIASQGISELKRYGKHFIIRMLFRVTDPEEQAAALDFIGWPNTHANRQILTELEDGECIFRDLYGRTGTVQVVTPLEEYSAAFDTTLSNADWTAEYEKLYKALQPTRKREFV